jgi:predicted glycoside hydrolase/deacetylase ChbG (UPF0249 family)
LLIITADDFGRNRLATDRICECFFNNNITSISAMVFMEDSQRAAEIIKDNCLDIGLHLNFTEKLSQKISNQKLHEYHNQIVQFLTKYKFNFLLINPFLRNQFEYSFRVQLDEFERLYAKSPVHIDGHHHMHLCTNMIFYSIIPTGYKVRRNFTFRRGEKSILNRTYRAYVDNILLKKHIIPDYLFSLSHSLNTGQLSRVFELSKSSHVELQSHPELDTEFEFLMSNTCNQIISTLQTGSFAHLS